MKRPPSLFWLSWTAVLVVAVALWAKGNAFPDSDGMVLVCLGVCIGMAIGPGVTSLWMNAVERAGGLWPRNADPAGR